MSTTESYIKTSLDRIRMYMDEVSDNGKYTDTILIKNILSPAISDVMHRIHNSSQIPVVCAFDFTMAANSTSYALPPCIGQVWQIKQVNDNGELGAEVYSRHDLNISGYGARVEGSSFNVQAASTTAASFRIFYVHNGKAGWHYGGAGKEGTAATVSSVSTVVLNMTPTVGAVDRRINAYGGQLLRTFPTVGVIEERVIDTYQYSASQWSATLRQPFDVVDSTIAYEIVPPGPETMWEAIITNSCLKLATVRQVTNKKYQMLSDIHKGAMKTCMEQAGNHDGRLGKTFNDRTKDNADYRVWI